MLEILKNTLDNYHSFVLYFYLKAYKLLFYDKNNLLKIRGIFKVKRENFMAGM